jgi:hypothetical protein
MKLAVVVGGWHWPSHIFRRIPRLAGGADLFVVAHRDPYQVDAWGEKCHLFVESHVADPAYYDKPLVDIDRGEMYAECIEIQEMLRWLDWDYQDAPNTSGDWTFFQQWLDTHDYRKYDVILNCHDDTYFRPGVNVFDNLVDGHENLYNLGCPLMIANGRFPQAPAGYVRGSFEFWTRELLDMLGGRIPIPELSLNREGLTDTPKDFVTLMAWNAIGDPLRKFFCDEKLTDRVHYLSEFYRVSEYLIEGERGLISSNIGAPWSFNAGLEKYPL